MLCGQSWSYLGVMYESSSLAIGREVSCCYILQTFDDCLWEGEIPFHGQELNPDMQWNEMETDTCSLTYSFACSVLAGDESERCSKLNDHLLVIRRTKTANACMEENHNTNNQPSRSYNSCNHHPSFLQQSDRQQNQHRPWTNSLSMEDIAAYAIKRLARCTIARISIPRSPNTGSQFRILSHTSKMRSYTQIT